LKTNLTFEFCFYSESKNPKKSLKPKEVKMIDEFALAAAASTALLAQPDGPRFDGKRWIDGVGSAHAEATAREVRTVLAEAAHKTNDLDDEARLKTAARLDAVLKVIKSFPALTVEAGEENAVS
jgi:hypothetical protein